MTFAGLDIGALSHLPLHADARACCGRTREAAPDAGRSVASARIPSEADRRRSASRGPASRASQVLLDLGLGYLSLDRSTPTLSPGELQRLRLATQIRSNLFGVVYVLDEPSAGLHPADTRGAARARFEQLKAAGNSLFVVEHDLDVMRAADWIVDVGPGAGEHGGHVLYSGPPDGLADGGGIADARATSSPSSASRAADAARPRAAGSNCRRHAQQPARPRRRASRSAC